MDLPDKLEVSKAIDHDMLCVDFSVSRKSILPYLKWLVDDNKSSGFYFLHQESFPPVNIYSQTSGPAGHIHSGLSVRVKLPSLSGDQGIGWHALDWSDSSISEKASFDQKGWPT